MEFISRKTSAKLTWNKPEGAGNLKVTYLVSLIRIVILLVDDCLSVLTVLLSVSA